MKSFVRFIVFIHMLLFSLALSWLFLYQSHFLYGVFHNVGGIKEGIEQFAPLNKYKSGFETTNYDQRVKVFAQISQAVHNGGEGLSEITYQASSTNKVQYLLREPEVVHLQDVANLIDTFKPLFWWSLIFIPLLAVLLVVAKPLTQFIPIPNACQSLYSLSVIGVCIALVLLGFGAENVFNQLHIWIFPKEHQWFFYYQESLMSTLMYAPILFAWIAAAWAVLAVMLYVLCHFVLIKSVKIAMSKREL